jgi:hypothetical protein
METTPALDTQTLIAMMLTVLPIVFLVALVPTVLFFLTLQRALARCAPTARTMSPGQVWFGVIPVFNLVWPFYMVNAISTSLHNEFVRRGIVEEPAPAKTIGMAFATLGLLSIIPLLNILTALPTLVCWIVYWVKIAGFSKKLAAPPAVPA